VISSITDAKMGISLCDVSIVYLQLINLENSELFLKGEQYMQSYFLGMDVYWPHLNRATRPVI